MWRFEILIVSMVILASTALPSHAATIAAGTCSASDVQSAINTAVTGDTVVLPPGACTWGASEVNINGKNITLQGAGMDVTTITSSVASGHAPINVGHSDNLGNSSRVTGMTIQVPGSSQAIIIDGDGWRVDHVKCQSLNAGALIDCVWAYGLRTGTFFGPTGLVDHVTFLDARVIVFGF